MDLTRKASFEEMDLQDPLAAKRALFDIPEGLVYLDGNSLGCLPKATVVRVQDVVTREWGQDLITSWNKADWIGLSARVGDQIARLVGAKSGEVVAADSTSINVFKMIAAAVRMQKGRKKIVSDTANFPTDLYMMEGVIKHCAPDMELVLADEKNILDHLDEDVAVLSLTHVNFKSGRMYDMAAITKAAQEKGILTVWDLSHSAGAVPVDLNGANADFAVGCGYKYFNGGPGAPAFLFIAERHQEVAEPPLSGWMGHSSPFAFDLSYSPADGAKRHLCGTPSVIGMSALHESLKVFDDVTMAQLREKSLKLSSMFIKLVEENCAEHGFELITPRDEAQRGSQASFAHPEGYAIMQALIADGVVGDFRAPNVVRFGFTPLYVGYADVYEAVERLKRIMDQRLWVQPAYQEKSAVT